MPHIHPVLLLFVVCSPLPSSPLSSGVTGNTWSRDDVANLFFRRGEPYNIADWTDAQCQKTEEDAKMCVPAEHNIFDFLHSRHNIEAQITANVDDMRASYASGKRLKLVNAMDRAVWQTEAGGNMYVQSAGTLVHGAEQLEHLVAKGKLPQDFLSIARAYRATAREHFRDGPDGAVGQLYPQSTHPRQLTFDGCCFVPTGDQLSTQHFMHNTLVYLPPSPPIGTAALNPDVDWQEVKRKYQNTGIVTVDTVLSSWALEAAYDFLLEATIYNELKHGYVGAYNKDGLSAAGVMQQITEELCVVVQQITGDCMLTNFWSYKYDNVHSLSDNRQMGILKHADAAELNLNMWLTPDSATQEPENAGMTIYNFGADTPKLLHLSQNLDSQQELTQLMFAAKTQSARIPYKQNRMVLFNSRLIHETGVPDKPMTFLPGYENRRISLTWLFGTLMDKKTGEALQ